ncbi:hypothetical protein HMPREF1317_1028 [Schaalia georgiae F0490]|uniref:Uncharacterized protein n=1 Tax=Schaalia georgiae F0490 TaxID=1125717 RepID=J1H1P3_9ACTO|nr:hypothetical protein HMPREF1317_1028 [Schaalia georgiae F0490]
MPQSDDCGEHCERCGQCDPAPGAPGSHSPYSCRSLPAIFQA